MGRDGMVKAAQWIEKYKKQIDATEGIDEDTKKDLRDIADLVKDRDFTLFKKKLHEEIDAIKRQKGKE